MRALYHPRVDEVTVQGILHALSDPVRLRIFVGLMGEGRLKNCATFTNVGGDAPLAKSTLSQHFKVLREAGLIRSERRGVELQNRTRCDELAEKFGPLVGAIVAAYAAEAAADQARRA